MGSEGGVEDSEIDESGTCNFRGGADFGELGIGECIDDFLGEGTRIGLALFCGDHGDVGLVVAEFGVLGGAEKGRGFEREGVERGLKLGGDLLRESHGRGGF